MVVVVMEMMVVCGEDDSSLQHTVLNLQHCILPNNNCPPAGIVIPEATLCIIETNEPSRKILQ